MRSRLHRDTEEGAERSKKRRRDSQEKRALQGKEGEESVSLRLLDGKRRCLESRRREPLARKDSGEGEPAAKSASFESPLFPPSRELQSPATDEGNDVHDVVAAREGGGGGGCKEGEGGGVGLRNDSGGNRRPPWSRMLDPKFLPAAGGGQSFSVLAGLRPEIRLYCPLLPRTLGLPPLVVHQAFYWTEKEGCRIRSRKRRRRRRAGEVSSCW